ncbi:beta-microseminoprotein [Xyrichtys novacula]|uniref:Beta-microseminoprotein n=1 Tax=Xyrichtys novacula TaxID=13765 RepID=A0AAV1G2X4_XYRNO|nr:beta-microseminoprotein [Xyrichtys novacula]
MYDYGARWEKDCKLCRCSFRHGIVCCDKFISGRAVNLPPNCEQLIDKEACGYKLVLKSDHNVPCPLGPPPKEDLPDMAMFRLKP